MSQKQRLSAGGATIWCYWTRFCPLAHRRMGLLSVAHVSDLGSNPNFHSYKLCYLEEVT